MTHIAINRFVDMSLVFFNSLVALMLFTAPWYIVNSDTEFPAGCALTKGVVIAPFSSEFCGVSMTSMELGGDTWTTMYFFVVAYLIISLAMSVVIGYEVVTHGVRQWNDANTIGFALNVVLLIVLSFVLAKSNSVVKPSTVRDATARTLTTLALVLVCLSLSPSPPLALVLLCLSLSPSPPLALLLLRLGSELGAVGQ